MTRSMRTPISQITDQLYLCGVGAINAVNMEKRGITHILNTAVELSDFHYPSDNDKSFKVCHIVMRDAADEDLLRYLDTCVDHVNTVCQNNGTILVHCVAGVSRSASVCIAYLMKYKRMTLKKAFYHVMNKRPCIFPNFGFWRHLVDYELDLIGFNSVELLPMCLGMVPNILLMDVEYRLQFGWMDDLIGLFGVHLLILVIQIICFLIF